MSGERPGQGWLGVAVAVIITAGCLASEWITLHTIDDAAPVIVRVGAGAAAALLALSLLLGGRGAVGRAALLKRLRAGMRRRLGRSAAGRVAGSTTSATGCRGGWITPGAPRGGDVRALRADGDESAPELAARRRHEARAAPHHVPPRAARRFAGLASLSLAGFVAALTWAQASTRLLREDDLARLVPVDPLRDGPFVRAFGVVLDAPRPSIRDGSMAAFDTRSPRWRFRMQVSAVAAPGGAPAACAGILMVGVASEGAPEAQPGDRIAVGGRLSGFSPRRNPGGFDARAWARRSRLSAAMWLDAADSLQVLPEAPASGAEREASRLTSGLLAAAQRVRGELRAAAAWALLSDLPAWTSDELRALLAAMFLGRRDAALLDLEEAFRRTGAVHLVAISGFNLAVLAAAATALARAAAPGRRRRGGRATALLVIAIVSLYLVIVEAQPAVLRAGAMILVARLGQCAGRRWTMRGVYALSASVLLVAAPADVANAGFQLSFAVVGALLWLAPTLEERWFGRQPADGRSLGAFLSRHLRRGLAAACAAWLVASPIVLVHFGLVSPLAAPLSLAAVPVASTLLVTGYANMLVGPLVPGAGEVLGWALALLAGALAGLVRAADALPGSALHLPPPEAWWAVASLGAVSFAIAARRGRTRRAASTAVLLLWLWPFRELLPARETWIARIDMLAVGDGSCVLVRGEGCAVLFDAGSTDVSVGDRVIVPALRALGVRRLDAIIVSHANLDHFAGVIEVVDAIPTGGVLLTEQFLHLAHEDPEGAPAALVSMLRRREIPIEIASSGDERRFGALRWRWIHPEMGARPRRVNDTSQVIVVELGPRRLLLSGDIEAQAIAAVRRRLDGLRIDLLELPHHGSASEAALDFARELSPAVALQSTGRRRLARDPWPSALPDTLRPVTARDGAIRIEVEAGGSLRAGWMEMEGMEALPAPRPHAAL